MPVPRLYPDQSNHQFWRQDLGTSIVQSLPGKWNMQSNLRTTAPGIPLRMVPGLRSLSQQPC